MEYCIKYGSSNPTIVLISSGLICDLFCVFQKLQHRRNRNWRGRKKATIFAIENSFTGAYCVDENQPIIKIDSAPYACLSKDGSNCYKLADLNPENNDPNSKFPKVTCKDFNKYISTEGIRNVNRKSRQIIDDLEKN
jgi:hypothetical protein